MIHRALKAVAFFAAGLVPLAGCASAGGAAPAPAGMAASQEAPPPLLYVANQSSASVSVIDMTTDEVVETVDLQALGYTANAKPHHVAVEPDGSYWYVSLIADGYVLKFDRNNELVGRAPFETPGLLALQPDGDLLYVGRSMAAVNPPQRIGVIERSTMDIDEIDVFIARPHALLVTPDGEHVFTASLAGNQVVSYMPDTGESEILMKGVSGEHAAHGDGGAEHPFMFVQFALSPDGRRMVVGGEMISQLFVMDAAQPMSLPIIETIDVPAAPWHPVFSPDGSRVYFGNNRADAVTFIDTSDWSVERTVTHPRFAQPHGIAISPDGSKLYVANRNAAPLADGSDPGNGFVAVIDTATGEVTKFIEVGKYAAGMGTATPRN